MANGERVRLNPQMDFPTRLLWRIGWKPWLLYGLCVAVAIAGGFALHSVYGFLLGLVVLIARWKANVLINGSLPRLLKLAESAVSTAGANRVGVELDASECKVISIGRGAAPFGVRASPEYSISAVYACEAFFGIFAGSTLALPDFELRLATSGDEIYFRNVSTINYRDSAIEILLSHGKKSKQIAVGSEANATALLEVLRARLRQPARPAVGVQAPARSGEDLQQLVAHVDGNSHGDGDEERRYCYLRSSKLAEYYSDPAVLSALMDQLGVPGTAATWNRMTDDEKRAAIENEIKHFHSSSISVWRGVPTHEVVAATIWRMQGNQLSKRLVRDKFCAVSREEDLARPVARWLANRGEHPYMEVPLGRRRIDVLGYKKPGFTGSGRLTAVELKNDDDQFRRGPDQMGTFAEYAHTVYLACTPAFAADYLDRNAENRNVNHWDSGVLDRKLKQGGFGLLVVERDNIFEVIKPVQQSPADVNVSKVVGRLTDFQRIELD